MKDLFANRGFLSVWAAQFVSGLGDKIILIALFALILDVTGNVISLGLLAAVQILPGVALGPVIGIVLDRWDRRRAMIISDVCCAAAAALIPFAPNLTAVYALAVVLAVGRQVSGPARLALIPDLVPADQLKKTNALAMLTSNIVLLVGMGAGGVIVGAVGVRPAFWADAGTFLASASILALGVGARRARRDPPTPSATPALTAARARWRGLLDEARHGAVAIWERPRLRFAVVFLAAVTAVTAMQPPLVFDFVKNGLGRSERELGFIFAAAGLGGIVGALIAGLRRDRKHPLATVTRLVILDGLLLVLFSINRNVPVAALLFGCFGAISTGLQVNLTTFLQHETDEAERGRIFGWLNPLLGPVSLVSVLAGPVLGRLAGVGRVLLLAGIGEAAAGGLGAVLLPRRADSAADSGDAEAAPPFGSEAEETPSAPRTMAGEA